MIAVRANTFSFFQSLFAFDDNDGCYADSICNDTLHVLVSRWEKIIRVMSFDWSMDVGSMIANFNYLLDSCSQKYNLETDKKMWAPNNPTFRGQCQLDGDTKALYKDLETITEGIFQAPAKGLYLNDLIAYLGYSTTFDISSLTKENYLSTTRSLHPIYGMDRWQDVYEWKIEDSRKQCNYLGTYQKWVRHTLKRSSQTGNLGTMFIKLHGIVK